MALSGGRVLGAVLVMLARKFEVAKTDWPTQGPFLPLLAELFLRTRPRGSGEPAFSLPGSPVTWSSADPAHAGAITLLGPDAAPLASVGYGIAYPFSMISMVLLIQFLPHLLKRPIKAEEQEWLAEKEIETPGLVAQQFRITNPNCEGKTVAEVNPRRLAKVNLSRVKHGERVFAATPETVLHVGDLVMAVQGFDERALRRLAGGATRGLQEIVVT